MQVNKILRVLELISNIRLAAEDKFGLQIIDLTLNEVEIKGILIEIVKKTGGRIKEYGGENNWIKTYNIISEANPELLKKHLEDLRETEDRWKIAGLISKIAYNIDGANKKQLEIGKKAFLEAFSKAKSQTLRYDISIHYLNTFPKEAKEYLALKLKEESFISKKHKEYI
jgi:hypothetical protein